MKNCSSCQKNKADLVCGICECGLCKNCAQFMEENSFSFLKEIPKDLTHRTYCDACYNTKVYGELEAYNQDMEQAKQIAVFYKGQEKETRLIRRAAKQLVVKDCPDKAEALLRLAFFAAKAKFNALVDVALTPEKVRMGAYQTQTWSATGVPVNVDVEKYNRK